MADPVIVEQIPQTRFGAVMVKRVVSGRIVPPAHSAEIVEKRPQVALQQRGPRGQRGQIGPQGFTKLALATDVDLSDLTDGDALVFDASNGVFRPEKPRLDAGIIDGGNF